MGAPPPLPMRQIRVLERDYTVDMCAEKKYVGLIAKFLTRRDIFFSRAVHCITSLHDAPF